MGNQLTDQWETNRNANWKAITEPVGRPIGNPQETQRESYSSLLGRFAGVILQNVNRANKKKTKSFMQLMGTNYNSFRKSLRI